jgi:Dienelactone hydrolase family
MGPAMIAEPVFLSLAGTIETSILDIPFVDVIMLSESDMMFPLASRRRAEDILFGQKASYHIQVFSGVEHGFAVRGNPEIENERTYGNFYVCL